MPTQGFRWSMEGLALREIFLDGQRLLEAAREGDLEAEELSAALKKAKDKTEMSRRFEENLKKRKSERKAKHLSEETHFIFCAMNDRVDGLIGRSV